MRRIFLSTRTASRLLQGEAWLLETGRTGALILGATRRAADDFARNAVLRRGHLLGVHRAQISQLARELAKEVLTERQEAPVSGLGRRALAARATFAVAETRGLRYFGPIHRTPGFPKALARTLLELRLAGLDTDDLRERLHFDAGDLAHLLSAYEGVSMDGGLADDAGVLSAAAEAVSRTARPPIGLPLLMLDAPPRSALEFRFLRALVSRAPRVAATLHQSDTHGLDRLVELLGDSVELIEAEERESDGLAHVRHGLFGSALPALPSSGEHFELFSAASEAEEAVEITRRILWLGERGQCFDEMAVFLRAPEVHGPFLRDAFRRSGVPGFFTEEIERPDPAGRALLALLECAAEGYSASRFSEYLSLGQAPAPSVPAGETSRAQVPWVAARDRSQLVFNTEVMPEPPSARAAALVREPSAPLHWERLLVDASVVGERPRWARRLRGLEEELLLRLRALDPEEPRRAELERQVDGVRRLQAFALPIIEFLASLPAQATWGAWLDFLGELALVSLAEPTGVLATLADLRPMARVGPVTLAEVREVLREELGSHRPSPEERERRFGRVFVGTIDEAAGRSFEHVFLPGLAEGSFPKKVEEDPLLLDEARVHLDALLETQERRTHAERLRLHLAVAAARTKLVASFPRLDRAAGRARVPSFYALDLLRAAQGELPDLRTLEARALAGAEVRIGWPAPTSADRSIDETEHDLAVLAELFESPREEARGRARYLLESNPHLGRSLRREGRRWLPAWRTVDGLVDPGAEALALLDEHRLHRKSHSPGALEHYAACPYRFLLHSIHGLRPRPTQPRLEILDPLTRSSIEHEVQFRFLDEWAALQAEEAQISLDAALARLDRLLENVTTAHEDRLSPAVPQVWRRGIEVLRSDLRGWVRDLLAQPSSPGAPQRWRLSYGPPQGAAPGRLGDFLIHGTIDFVEYEHASKTRWAVHTAPGQPTPRAPRTVGRGESLRPLLDALGLEAEGQDRVAGGRTYHATQRGGYRRVDLALTEGSRRSVRRVLEAIDRAIETGFLPQAPRRGACAACEYRLICGPHEETRAARKDRRRLAELSRIRGMD